MKTTVYNQQAQSIGDFDLSEKVFSVKPNLHLMAESVRVQLAGSRQGGGHTKTRGEVSGGGKKPWKQKGTGRARAGSTRSPIWRHGGITFGPRNTRNWELKINKKAKRAALCMSLTDKAQDGKLVMVDNIALSAPKTKEFVTVLAAFEKEVKGFGKNILFVLPKKDDLLERASKNLPTLKPITASNLNIVDVLKADYLFMLKDSVGVIEKTFVK
ncbi:MAG TPA: 50S ribosomal protein L4 [Patescibacteria group bacterium]|nr:50S ribosomal protein L4 [Patescibacteria group bacterium]